MDTAPRLARSIPSRPQAFAYAHVNSLATVSVICGLLGLLCLVPILGSIAALAFGYVARRQIASRHQRGRARAISGIVLGWAGLAVSSSLVTAVVLR